MKAAWNRYSYDCKTLKDAKKKRDAFASDMSKRGWMVQIGEERQCRSLLNPRYRNKCFYVLWR